MTFYLLTGGEYLHPLPNFQLNRDARGRPLLTGIGDVCRWSVQLGIRKISTKYLSLAVEKSSERSNREPPKDDLNH